MSLATGAAMPALLTRINPSRYVIYVGFLVIFAVFAVVLRDDGFRSESVV